MNYHTTTQSDSAAIFSFKDPHLETYTQGTTCWLLSGVRLCPNKDWHFYLGEPGAEEKLCRQWGDVLIVRVDHREDGTIALVQAWKGLSASYEFYFGTLDGGRLIAADNFKSVCAHLPAERRKITESAIIDHLLFRAVTNDQTHVKGIRRLGFGSTVVLRADGHILKEHIFHKVSAPQEERPTGVYVDRIHSALEESVAPVRHFSKLATLFTGGVDSTLVQSYSNGWATPVNVRPGCLSEKWRFQSTYARKAARLSGKELMEIPIPLDSTLDEMVRSIRLAGLPQRDFHSMLWPTALGTDHDIFLSGERADSYFCGASTREAITAYWLNKFVPFLISREEAPFWAQKGSLNALWTAAKRMARATDDVYSAVSLVSCGDYTNIPWLIEQFGQDKVEARLANRLDYVRNRMETNAIPENDLYARVHLSAWTSSMSVEELSRLRQMAHSLGKVVHSPFSAGRVVQTSMEIPVHKRYQKNFKNKYLLKALLKRRLPEYPINQKKGVTGLDFKSFYQSGPLSSIWERYPVPDFVPVDWSDAAKKAAVSPRGSGGVPTLTWNVANLAIWEQEVLKGAELPRRRVRGMVPSNDNTPAVQGDAPALALEVDDAPYHGGRRNNSKTIGH